MAVTNQEVILTFNADTSGVEQSIGNVEKSVEDTSQATAGLTNQLDKMTGGAVTGFRNMTKGVKTAITGMKTLKGAVAATGIGLLLVAITSLVAYFKRTERGAQALRKITATLGAVMDKLVDVVINLGEGIFNAFTNPKEAILGFADTLKTYVTDKITAILDGFGMIGKAIKSVFEGDFENAAKLASEGLQKIYIEGSPVVDLMKATAKATGEFADELTRTANAANDLADRENKLKVAERDFLSVRAETNKLIAEKRLLVEDEKMAMEERIGALEEAIEAEQKTIAQELAFAKERADILEAQSKLAESDEETLQAVAEARARVTELETSSLRTQKRLEGERQSLLLQQEARLTQAIEAERKAAEEQIKILEATFKAIKKRQEEEAKELLIPTDEVEKTLMVQQMQTQAVETESEKRKRLRQEEAEAFRDLVLGDEEMLIETTKKTLGVLADLNSAFEGDSEKEQKKAFERSKKIQSAQALISTYESAVQAYKSLSGIPLVGPVLGAAAAIAAVKAGLNNVQKIKAQTFQGSGGGEPDTPSTSLSAGAGAGVGAGTQAPQLDLSFLGEGAGQAEPIQAFVVAQDVSNAQQANQQIQDQATL